MDDRVQIGGLSVAGSLHRFLAEEALPASGVDPDAFWSGAEALIAELAPRTRELLARREELQTRIDAYHREHPGVPDAEAYTAFLTDIGYLLQEPEDFEVSTSGGGRRGRAGSPARSWSSRCSTPASPPTPPTPAGIRSTTRSTAPTSSPARATSPPATATTRARGGRSPRPGPPRRPLRRWPAARTPTPRRTPSRGRAGGRALGRPDPVALADPAQLVGYRGDAEAPEVAALVHHGLHVEVLVDREDPIGSTDAAGVKDLLMESAVSNIDGRKSGTRRPSLRRRAWRLQMQSLTRVDHRPLERFLRPTPYARHR